MPIENGAVVAPFFIIGRGISYSFFPEVKKTFLRNTLQLISKYMNELTSTSYSSVTNQLRELTQNYLTKHPTLTLNALAQRSGVAATTLRRLMQEDSRSDLAPHSVLALVSYLLKEKCISKILKKVEGPIGELLRKSFDQFIFNENTNHELNSDLNKILEDKTTYLIYKLAANKCGTTIDEIKKLFGLTGMHKLNFLIESKWVYTDLAERLHAKDKNFSLDLELAHQHSHALVDFYKPRDVDSGQNLFYSLSEGMNSAGIKKIKEIEKDAVKKIFEIMNDEKFQGTNPYFAIILSDILGFTPNQQDGVLQ
jgi:hypothetical protein